ncbi:hypothetical protein GCM10011375_40000 [Hymenobacter qilianensis]|uniref:Uncharacterized protein n=1 Tax=Hymenobacter qilianensis TaxID=1385715 RepID=A0ACB5PXD5_9BACT|nr:hypothetical protein GCM10011375_40000 [Hymenobacter qilianensis]
MLQAGFSATETRLSGYAGQTGFFALLAGLSAHTTMVVVLAVLGTFHSAGMTDLSTELQQVLGVLGSTGHEAGSQGTNIGAVAVQLNTAGHHLHVLLLQAGGGAVLAGSDTGVEGSEEALILIVHRKEG